ncbi:MAG: hypothetical protein ACTSV8_05790, partial [Candidatus Thorarchaeota archaeon]
ESFLVRRALCGIEPTGLLTLFRNMWGALGGEPTGQGIAQAIGSSRTIEWPDDGRLEELIVERRLYGSAIAPFAILEYDRSLRTPDMCGF